MGAPRDEGGRSSHAGRAPIDVAYAGRPFKVCARASSSPGLLEREIIEVFDGKTGQVLGFAIVVERTRIAGVGRRSSHISEADVRAVVASFLLARSSSTSSTRRRVTVVESDVPRLLRELADLVEQEGLVGSPPETIERVVRAVIPSVDEDTAAHLRERLSTLRAEPDDDEPGTRRGR